MWIDSAEFEDVFSHHKTAITFDRSRPIGLFIGRNGAGKTPTSRAIELGLTGSILALRGTGLTMSRLVRTGAAVGQVRLVAHATPDAKPVEIRRRLTAKGIDTAVNGTRSTRDSFDLFARTRSEVDIAAVFQVLCNVDGFFAIGANPQDTARRQKDLLVGLIDRTIPADTFPVWPPAFGAIPTTFALAEEAYGVASERLTALGKELDLIVVDQAILKADPVTDELIAQIEERIRSVREDRDARITAQGDAAGQRTTLTEALKRGREQVDDLRGKLERLGVRPDDPDLEDRQATAQRIVDIDVVLAAKRRAQGILEGTRSALTANRDQRQRDLDQARAQQEPAGQIGAADGALRSAKAELGLTVERDQAWQEAMSVLSVKRGRLQAIRLDHKALKRDAFMGKAAHADCGRCRRRLRPIDAKAADATFVKDIAALEGEIATDEAALGPQPDVEPLRERVRAAEERVRSVQAANRLAVQLKEAVAAIEQELAVLPQDDQEIEPLTAEHDQLSAALAKSVAVSTYDTERDQLDGQIEAWGLALSIDEEKLGLLPAEDPEIAVLTERLTIGEARLREALDQKRAREKAEADERRAGMLGAEEDIVKDLREQLGPKGVRERLLIQRLGAVTDRVNGVLGTFGLTLAFQDPWEVHLNGQPPILMGETELMRAGFAFQVALADATGAKILMLDRIGNLDARNRAILFDVLNQALDRGWIEQAFLFSTYVGQDAPTASPAPNVALYHVVRPEGAPTNIARVA